MIALFAVHEFRVIELFLDLCHGRSIIHPYSLSTSEISSLIKLIDDTRSHELRRRLFASDVPLGQQNLRDGLQLANEIRDVALAAKCLRKLAVSLCLGKWQQAYDVVIILDLFQLEWRAILFKILLEDDDYEDSYDSWESDFGYERVVVRRDWEAIADEFEEHARHNVELQAMEQAGTQLQAKRAAETQQPAGDTRSGKVRRTGNR